LQRNKAFALPVVELPDVGATTDSVADVTTDVTKFRDVSIRPSISEMSVFRKFPHKS